MPRPIRITQLGSARFQHTNKRQKYLPLSAPLSALEWLHEHPVVLALHGIDNCRTRRSIGDGAKALAIRCWNRTPN